MYEVSWLTVVVAGIVNVIIGFLWYNPRVFGAAWMRHVNLTPEAAMAGKQRMPLMAVFGALAAMLVAYVMSHFATAWGVYDLIGAVELGFWCWAGFAVPILLSPVLWEGKRFGYFLINAGFWLVSFIAISLILVL